MNSHMCNTKARCRTLVPGLLGLMTATAVGGGNIVVNGDFSNGLNGWQIEKLVNPNQPAGVADFDIDGSGPLPSSDALFVQAGAASGENAQAALVRVTQQLNVTPGQTYQLTADVATENGNAGGNDDGGTIEARIGDRPVDAVEFVISPTLPPGEQAFGTLTATFEAQNETETLELKVLRAFNVQDFTPTNYIDNVIVEPTDENAPPAPAPGPDVPDGDLFVVSGFGGGGVTRHDGETGELIGPAAPDDDVDLPRGIAFQNDGTMLISDTGQNHIAAFDPLNAKSLGVFADDPLLFSLLDMTFGPDGNLYVVSQLGDRVLQIDDASGDVLNAGFISNFNSPAGLAFGPQGNLYVSSGLQNGVFKFNGETGEALGEFATGSEFCCTEGVTFGPDGHLYTTIFDNGPRVYRFHGVTGDFLGVAAVGGGMDDGVGLTFTPDGTLLVNSIVTDNVIEYDITTGLSLGVFADEGIAGPHFGIQFFDVEITGDLTDDGVVGVADLLELLSQWGPCPAKGECPADFDDDDQVGVSDLLTLLGNWG